MIPTQRQLALRDCQIPQKGLDLAIQASGMNSRLVSQIPPCGGTGERLTLGFDFILSRSISETARLFYEQPKSPGFTIPPDCSLTQTIGIFKF